MPRYRTMLVREDDSEEAVPGGHDDLEAACRAAFALADRLDRKRDADNPRWVAIYQGDRLELSIQISVGRPATG